MIPYELRCVKCGVKQLKALPSLVVARSLRCPICMKPLHIDVSGDVPLENRTADNWQLGATPEELETAQKIWDAAFVVKE